MFEDDAEYQSDICKKTSSFLDSLPPFIGTPALIITIASLFFGGWLVTLVLVIGIFVAAYISFKSYIRLLSMHTSMMKALKWDYNEWDTYGRVRNVITKKIFIFLPIYVYTVVIVYFITGFETNIQKLGITGVFLALLAIQYEVIVSSDYNLDQQASEVKAIFAEAILIALGLVGVAIGNFFITIGFSDILIGLGLTIILTTSYLRLRPLTPMDD